MLRLDDTDVERSRPEFAAGIERDLIWLGLDWQEKQRQSDRLARYAAAAEALKVAGRLYPCFETPEELNFMRKRLLGRGLPPIYDRAALKLSADERTRFEAEGRRPHWRFRLADTEIIWQDLVRGETRFHGAHLSDPVVIRGDGTPLYTLPSVVDDLEMGISHVIRGEDHVANTAVQVQIFEALMAISGGVLPVFAHLPLLTDAGGQGLSKRLGSLSLEELRDQHGIEPLALTSLLATLGSSENIALHGSLDALVAGFDITAFGRASPKFNLDELAHLNARYLHGLSFSEAAAHLRNLGLRDLNLGEISAEFWEAVRPNLDRLDAVRDWQRICYETIDTVVEDQGFLETAADLLPDEPWDEATWGVWTARVKEASGHKGKALFLPLRRALTGCDHGPELKNLLPIIGRERALARLCGGRG